MGELDDEVDLPWVISSDDHVIEPPHLWARWLPARYRDRGPRVEAAPTVEIVRPGGMVSYTRGDDGPIADWWLFEELVVGTPLVTACVGYSPDDYSMQPMRFADMRTGCYEPQARLADMDEARIERSLCFPNYPRFAGQMFSEATDKELALACVEAYNDWMVDEWCVGPVRRDPARVGPAMPEVVHDLPGGARRLSQRSVGIRATLVGGEVLVDDGEPTDARPGRLLRRRGAGDLAAPQGHR